MNTPSTLAAYAAALVVVFGTAVGAGRLVGPVGAAPPEAPAPASAAGHDGTGHGGTGHGGTGHGGTGDGGTGHGGTGHGGTVAVPSTGADLDVGGLSVAADGYALRLARSTAPAQQEFDLSFTVTAPDGEPLLDYERVHDKDLHLVVVRRDLTAFAHLHPTRDDAGRWSLPVTLPEPGTYKVIADFTPRGRESALALAADLVVPGTSAPRPLPAPSRSTDVDGFVVTLDGALTAGRTSELTFTVRRDGRPVTDLDPYLGAYGHLVVLRAGDAAYLHVHPDESDEAGPEVVFAADVPAAGPHRLFLDFSVDGVVHTAELTLEATPADDDSGQDDAGHDDAGQDDAGHDDAGHDGAGHDGGGSS